jgi:outer membrane protein TolC
MTRRNAQPSPRCMGHWRSAARVGALLTAGLLVGCARLGPVRMDAELATPPRLGLSESDSFEAVETAEQASPTDDELHWWRQFDDPALAAWVERALQGNVDIALAAERVQQAQALLRSARAQQGFSLSAQADATVQLRNRNDERRLQPGAALALDYEFDLWGGLALAERSAVAGLLRSQDLVQAARLAAAGLSARAYIEWRTALEDQRLLAQGLALQSEALRVVKVRVDAGLAPLLDRERAQAEVAALQAEQAAAAVRVAQAGAALQVLAGERPQPGRLLASASTSAGLGVVAPERADTVSDAMTDAMSDAKSDAAAHVVSDAESGAVPLPDATTEAALPRLQGGRPGGRPLDLLRQRPDLRAAEQALRVAAADAGVADAALRPRLRLPGNLVFGALAGGGALELVSATVAAVLDVTLVDSGAAAAGVQAAHSRAREAALLYRQTLLQALQQVENAGTAERGAQRRMEARTRGVAASQAAEAQAQTLYRAGLSGFLDLLEAQRTALDNQRALLQAQADAAASAVNLFEALGWMAAPPAAPAQVQSPG